MTENPATLHKFLTDLHRQLEQMSPEVIRQALFNHAERLAASERGSFLNSFSVGQPSEPDIVNEMADNQQPVPDLSWPIEHDQLLEEIDDFVERVESGAYFQGFGWDGEIHDERSFGDESWVDEMEDYFAAANDTFHSGRLGLARAIYGKLFDALELDEEVGTFCGSEPALSMIGVELDEAMSRYLRTVYETTALPERASELITAWLSLPTPYDAPTLGAVRECRLPELPEFE